MLVELHPVVRWYIQHRMYEPETMERERYGEVYAMLASQAYENYDKDARLRYLVRQSLPDFEAALKHLPLPGSRASALAYHLAHLYHKLGQNQRALALCEQALEIDQQLGDVHGVAVVQSAIADVLIELGKPQEALALYEQALRIKEELGDVRGMIVIQNAMANVLVQQGELQKALLLFEQCLRIAQDLGEVRGVAITQSAMADVLDRQGKPQEALALYEQALRIKQELGDLREASITQGAIAGVLVELGKPQEAAELFEQALHIKQELGDVRGMAVTQANFCALLLAQGEYGQALPMAWEAYKSLSQHSYTQDAQFVQQLIISIKRRFLGPEQFDLLWSQAINKSQPDWLHSAYINLPGEDISVEVSSEAMRAVHDFVNAEDWETTRKMVEARQTVLFQPEVETLFEHDIARARSDGYQRVVDILELHLALLRDCKASGIEAAFAKFASPQHNDLLFERELIPRSIAALLGSPREKMAHMQYLTSLANETADHNVKSLIHTIQLALFSSDLSQLGYELQGIYRQVWETIYASVEAGGVDSRIFEIIVNNTLAVLGPSDDQRSVWRNNLVQMRNQSTTRGERNMVAMLNAVIGLLDAGGNPIGLGKDLRGVYAKTWQEIVLGLSE